MEKRAIAIPVDKKFLRKASSMVQARMLVSSRQIDMNIQECAEEIYAHTVVFYCLDTLKKIHINCSWLINHANPIDLEDGGDKPYRKVIYKLIWKLIPSR